MTLTINIILIIILVWLCFTVYKTCNTNHNKIENMADTTAVTQNTEAIQNLTSIYNNKDQILNTLKTTKDLSVDGTATINNLTSNGATTFNDVTINDNKTIGGRGRLNINGPELLYIVNKSGVAITKDGGASGNLGVQGSLLVNTDAGINGNTTVNGQVTANNNLIANGRTRFRVMDNMEAISGYDIGNTFKANSAIDCANQCMSKYNHALSAMYRKNDGNCWCKWEARLQNPNNTTMSTVFMY
jgi:hypothetical protein